MLKKRRLSGLPRNDGGLKTAIIENFSEVKRIEKCQNTCLQ